MKMKSALQSSVLAIAMVVAAGCASTNRVDELSARLDRVAADAKSAASGAQSTANQALNAANQSQSCCDATNEKIDRMFKRSQAK